MHAGLHQKTLVILGSIAMGLLVAGQAGAESTSFEITMTGTEGAPPGDPEGQAQGTLTLDSATGAVEWEFSYSGIAEPTAMHIHEGAAGAAGGVVVPLTVESAGEGKLAGSTTADPAVVRSILAAPENYYVNIHNAEYRPGAVRGQLAD